MRRKNSVDPYRPYAFLIEPERMASGRVEDVATLFLTNRECPYRCAFCDLWQNTTDSTVPLGAIPAQIDYALTRLPPAAHIKLYNSGNFFDRKAIPHADHAAIAERLRDFQTVIVENHPRLCGPDCREFRDRLPPNCEFEIALGLETVHPEVLPRLNKQMSTDDFQQACQWLINGGISVRAFVLLAPPYLPASEAVFWAHESVKFAFQCGARVCSVIPMRGSEMARNADFILTDYQPPTLTDLETVMAQGLALGQGRLFVDLWDAERFFPPDGSGPERASRLRQANLTQLWPG